MVVLVIINTVAIALISLLLLSVLRSQAEMIRRFDTRSNGLEVQTTSAQSPSLVPLARPDARSALDVAGATLNGGSLKLSVTGGRATLFAFLSSGCLTCQELWHGLPDVAAESLPLDARVVVVTKDREYESPSRLRALATRSVPLVMSSQAWRDYGVDTSPYFIFVEGRAGKVVSEGSATSWSHVLSLLRDSFEDLALG